MLSGLVKRFSAVFKSDPPGKELTTPGRTRIYTPTSESRSIFPNPKAAGTEAEVSICIRCTPQTPLLIETFCRCTTVTPHFAIGAFSLLYFKFNTKVSVCTKTIF